MLSFAERIRNRGLWGAGARTAGVFGFLALLGLLWGCSEQASGNPKADDPRKSVTVPVMVSSAAEKSVPVQLTAVGNVQAYSTVTVKARVEGQLTEIHFQEGQDVKKGDLLFTIDPRPFEAKLKHAEAFLAKDRAQLQNARRQVQRYSSVVKKGYVAEEQFDQIAANAEALEATVRADEAAVESAKLDVSFCSIRSPVDGCAGAIRVHRGNLIKANDNDNPLVVINQVSPIHVAFSVPERSLPEIRRRMAAGKLSVAVAVPGEDDHIVQGELTFLDNIVDTQTGTIQLKATFLNEDRMLWPGQFVNVILTLGTQSGAVVVPSKAVRSGQEGSYVYIVKPDMTVEYRTVALGRTVGDEVVINKGITPGEQVVTDGQLRLAPGSHVKILQKDEGQ